MSQRWVHPLEAEETAPTQLDGQLSLSQQTPSVQKPETHAPGLPELHGAPSGMLVGAAVGVIVGVGAVSHCPTFPETLQACPSAQEVAQHTPVTQWSEVHWVSSVHEDPIGSGVGVGGEKQLPACPEMLQSCPLWHCATTQQAPSVQWLDRH